MAKKKKKGIIIAVAVVAVIGLGVAGVSALTPSTENIAETSFTDSAEITRHDIVESISVSGNVKGDNVVKITSFLGSKIESLNVSVGDYVKKGDVLCVFDSSAYQKEYDSLKSSADMSDEMSKRTHEINERNLANAKQEKEFALAQAQRAITQAENARDRAYDKYNKAVDKYNGSLTEKDRLSGLISDVMSEDYEINYQKYLEESQKLQTYEAEMNALGDQLSSYDDSVQAASDAYDTTARNADLNIQALQDTIDSEKFQNNNEIQKQLDSLKEKIEECTVIAPQDGIITAVNVAEGNIPTTDALMTIEDDNALKISVKIKETDILSLKEGMRATIKTNATSDEEFEGIVSKVVNIYSGADPLTQSEGGYSAEITIDKKSDKLLMGMNAKVKIILNERKNVLAVPYDSITTDDDGNDIIYIAEEQGDGTYKAKAVKIEKGLDSEYYTEIISDGVKEGDIVITALKGMKDGKEVNIKAGE